MDLVLSAYETIPCAGWLGGGGVETELSWLRHWFGEPGEGRMNSVTAITVSCAAIHFPNVHNLQCHQRPIPLILIWCGRLKIPWVGKSVDSCFVLLISYIISLPRYNWNTAIACTDLSGKDLHRQIGMDTMLTSWSLGGVMVSTLGSECKRCGFNFCSRLNISHFHQTCDNTVPVA